MVSLHGAYPGVHQIGVQLSRLIFHLGPDQYIVPVKTGDGKQNAEDADYDYDFYQ
jgi:hypothetical protein